MHHIIRAALAEFGITARTHSDPDIHPENPLCFHHFTAGDLLIGNAKVVGSSQRKLRGALLQHGGILLASSIWTPSLPGIRELTGQELRVAEIRAAIERTFEKETGWCLTSTNWRFNEARSTSLFRHATAIRPGMRSVERKRTTPRQH
jgi:lipoate-protein ligase A